jgi:aspartate racemase
MTESTRPREPRGAGGALFASAGVVGVLGGMGPLATIDFVRKLRAATPASVDQQHVPLLVSCIPQVPDRGRAFLGEGPSPLAAMVESGQRLAAAGAGLLVISCNTAHLWFDAVHHALGLPMLHLVDAAVDEAVAAGGRHAHIGLLATQATVASGLYARRPCAGGPVRWLLPTAAEMQAFVTPGIAAVKAGRLAEGAGMLRAAAHALARRGAAAVVLGCTEIPLVLDSAGTGLRLIDATDALARRAVAWSLAQRAVAA